MFNLGAFLVIAGVLICGGIGLVFVILLVAYHQRTTSGHRTATDYKAPKHEKQPQAVNPDYNPETGQWEDWDGTPYGAIDADLGG